MGPAGPSNNTLIALMRTAIYSKLKCEKFISTFLRVNISVSVNVNVNILRSSFMLFSVFDLYQMRQLIWVNLLNVQFQHSHQYEHL